jgi:hypothetical protein
VRWMRATMASAARDNARSKALWMGLTIML